MTTPEVVFTVHPRPASDDPTLDDELDALSDRGRLLQMSGSPELVQDAKLAPDSIFGDIVFLMRYMIGRY